MKKTHVLACVAALLIGGLVSCNQESYDYTLKIWAAEKANELTIAQAKRWAKGIEETDGKKIGIVVNKVSESNSAAQMISDPESGADLFCFAQDQLARLRSAGALQTIVDPTVKEEIINSNDEASSSAVQLGGEVVAFPLTSDNGIFMYYDKSVFPDVDGAVNPKLDNMETIIEECKNANRKIYFNIVGSAWYSASYFYAFGCHSEWTARDDGTFSAYDDTYRSKEGVAACQAMYNLIKTNESVFIDDSTGATAFTKDKTGVPDAAVCVSGIWDYNDIASKLNTNIGATDLPSVTVNDETHHLHTFKGCKFLGVKRAQDPIKGAYAISLARFLTGEECQLERFNTLKWGPSNKNAQNNQAVKENIGLKALNLQYAAGCSVQGQYPDNWWTAAASIGTAIKDTDGSYSAIYRVLQDYRGTIDTYYSIDE